MTERPIIFSAPMVRAILDGSKSQTRRAINPQPTRVSDGLPYGNGPAWAHAEPGSALMHSPHGQPGSRLYVRETWAAPHAYDHLPPRLIPRGARIHYAATEDRGGLRWRPSIHMPRWAGRITLEVTGVRVERLQDISEADALAEGVSAILDEMRRATPRCDFQALWQSINGPGSWDANPWVWIVEFKRIKP